MAKIWRNRIVAGTQKFSDCPSRYKDAVLNLLRSDVETGILTSEKFEELTGTTY